MITRPPEKPDDASPVHWAVCEDIRVLTDDGAVLYAGPKYLRCKRAECASLVTHGMTHAGGCFCGNRRLGVALRLTAQERALVKRGYYPLCDWEVVLIRPTLPPGRTTMGWGKGEYEKRMAS